MEGIHAVAHDVGERFFLVLFNAALRKRVAVTADFPDLQVRGAVLRMLGGRDQFKAAVAVEISDGIEPGQLSGRLQHFIHVIADELELRVRV